MAEKYLSIWWFFVLVVIGVGITVSVLLFYGGEINIKSLEADLLSNKLIDCLLEEGYISWVKSEDIYKECGLNRELIENGKFFILLDLDGDEKKFGNNALEESCRIRKSVFAKNYPGCVEKDLKILDSGVKKNFKIMVGSQNEGGRL
jgi:hypothetical protein